MTALFPKKLHKKLLDNVLQWELITLTRIMVQTKKKMAKDLPVKGFQHLLQN